MKKILSLTALLLTGTLSQAQQYVPFPTGNVEWSVLHYHHMCEEPMDTTLYKYQLYGDTVLSGETYKKLGVIDFNSGATTPTIIGGIREEGEKVYYMSIPGNHPMRPTYTVSYEKELLYDFSAQIGDIVVHDSAGSFTSTVQQIDSVLMGSVYRKRLKVRPNVMGPDDYWVAGIGSTGLGLISRNLIAIECVASIKTGVCFTENGNTIYRNSAFQDCNANIQPNSIVEKALGAAIKIFPNPATNKEIRINNIMPGITLKVTDYTGRVLLTKALKQKDNVVQLPQAAFYILILSDKQGQIVRVEKVTGG